MAEVYAVISELCTPAAGSATIPLEHSSCTRDDSPQAVVYDDSVSRGLLGSSATKLAPRSELDVLLSKYRPEIIQLSTLRNQHMDVSGSRRTPSARSAIETPSLALAAERRAGTSFLEDFLDMPPLPLPAPPAMGLAAAEAAKAAAEAAGRMAELHKKESATREDRSAEGKRAAKTRRAVSQRPPAAGDFDISLKGIQADAMESRPVTISLNEESLHTNGDIEELGIEPSLISQLHPPSRRQQSREQMRSRERQRIAAALSSVESRKGENRSFLPQLQSKHSHNEDGLMASPRADAGHSLFETGEIERDAHAMMKPKATISQRKNNSKKNKSQPRDRTNVEAMSGNEGVGKFAADTFQVINGSIDLDTRITAPRELSVLSSGFDDIYEKMSKLLARADKLAEEGDDAAEEMIMHDAVVDSHSNAIASLDRRSEDRDYVVV
jgi:hypothetical protein